MIGQQRQRRLGWWAGAVALPLILIATLLGVVTTADTAIERIPVALVNNDELVEQTDEDGEEEIILASRPLVTELVSNDDFEVNWVITGSSQAAELLAAGEVYAVLEIPANFSEAVLTLDGDNPEQANFSITTDPSHSYLAGILSDQLGATIASTISAEFGREITAGLFTAIVDLGDGITEAADGAEEVAEATEELADGVSELKDGSEELLDGTNDLADGYIEYDDGLTEYLDGLRELADGAEELNRGTKDLPDLADGVETYTDSVSALSGALSGMGPTGNLTEGELLAVDGLIANLALLAAGGEQEIDLGAQAQDAISGVRTGITGLDEGADALAENSYPLEEGSDEIRSGIIDLADGVEEFDDGVGDLDEGTTELAEGMGEFADELSDAASEIAEEGVEEPSDSELDTLMAPINFREDDQPESIGFQETLTSVFVPVALWFVALLGTLRLPALSQRILGSTATTARIVRKSLLPVLGTVAIQAVVAIALMHTLGGLALGDLGWSTLVVSATALGFTAAHYLVWLWRPQLLVSLSVAAGVIQVITLGALIPLEALPGLYQTLGGLSPMAWSADALIAAIAGADTGRVAAGVFGLFALGALSLILARLALGQARVRAMRAALGLTDAV
ncbi:ABC transporter permease [Pontimonas sp.]|uniref:ABC transporter permease n=2 Tax=Pontimonas sp. TaxID=2304492 RepID=UPI00286FCE5B|nr:ABC transporter permease [Pontimonas sp.]MDR9434615.1 ABC transporter permease [Pontimonas sp.]